MTWQVRLVSLVKKAVMPYKNHKGKVKSIAVIDPGESVLTVLLSMGWKSLHAFRGLV